MRNRMMTIFRFALTTAIAAALVACNFPSPSTPAPEAAPRGTPGLDGEIGFLPADIEETMAAAEARDAGQAPEDGESPSTGQAPSPHEFATTIGENNLGFPADMPIPASWVSIPMPPALEAQGYVAAFRFDGFAEEALRDLLAVLLPTPSWVMDEVRLLTYDSTYIQQFGNMSTGFVAHAFITSNPDAIDLAEIDGAVLALKVGRYK